MRLWYQSMTCLEVTGRYAEAVNDVARTLFGTSVEVAMRGIEREAYGGYVPGDVFKYPLLKDILQRRSISNAIRAEQEGYDAFILGSFSEPFLKQTRAAISIPVVSIAETAFTTAWTLTERFGLISLAPSYARRLGETVARHGLTARFGGAWGLDSSYTEREAAAALENSKVFLEKFRECVLQAAAAGADLVIPAEGIVSLVVSRAGLREIDGIMIMDSVGLVLLQARMMVEARTKLGLGAARKLSFPVPPKEMRDLFT